MPQHKIAELTANGAEIIPINNIKGGIAGMFWRFMVADDNTVAHFVIARRSNLLEKKFNETIYIHATCTNPHHPA